MASEDFKSLVEWCTSGKAIKARDKVEAIHESSTGKHICRIPWQNDAKEGRRESFGQLLRLMHIDLSPVTWHRQKFLSFPRHALESRGSQTTVALHRGSERRAKKRTKGRRGEDGAVWCREDAKGCPHHVLLVFFSSSLLFILPRSGDGHDSHVGRWRWYRTWCPLIIPTIIAAACNVELKLQSVFAKKTRRSQYAHHPVGIIIRN